MQPVGPNLQQLATELAQSRAGLSKLFYDVESSRWQMFVPCRGCGGWLASLRTTEPERGDLAQTEAELLLGALAGTLCVNCQALALRLQPPDPAAEAFCWYDPPSWEWRCWQPLEGWPGGGVIVPLGVHLVHSQTEAVVAFSALVAPELLLPLAVSEEGPPGDREVHTLYYDDETDRFRLWAPCLVCGGVALPLSVTDPVEVEAAGERAMMMVYWLSQNGCMSCHARKQRGPGGGIPATFHATSATYWFDPTCDDWMLTCPLAELEDGVTIPLGIGVVDSSVTEIERAAQALLGDDFEAI